VSLAKDSDSMGGPPVQGDIFIDSPGPSSRSAAHLVIRRTEQLHPHPAVEELGLVGSIEEVNEVARQKDRSLMELLLITTDGTILAGVECWQLALLEGTPSLECFEYQLENDQCLPFILRHHRSRRGWNKFVRVSLALKMEPLFRQKALANMRDGGENKGLAKLPEAQHIDVRQQIAEVAGVGARTVANVKLIIKAADSRLITALQSGTLTINSAVKLGKLRKAEQFEELVRRSEDRELRKVIRQYVGSPGRQVLGLDTATVLADLQHLETRHPGSVELQVSRFRRTVVVVGTDLLVATNPQEDPEADEVHQPARPSSSSDPTALGSG
jgi:hypothetical protein